MANIDVSKMALPSDNNTYILKDNSQQNSDHRHYGKDMVPMVHKLYESTSYYATANDYANASWYFMSVKPDAWYKPWRVKFKVHTYCPSYASYESYTWSTFCGREGACIYANWNEKYSTAHSYITYYPLKKAGFDAGYGHAIGISIYNADNRTSSAYYRTFEIDYYECENCTVTILDTPVKWTNWTGTGTTNYGSLVAYDAISRGLRESGDDNTVTENRITYFAGKTGSKGIWAGSLFMEDAFGTYQDICTASDGTVTSDNRTTGTTKIANTNGFKPLGTIWWCNTTYLANTNISSSSVVYSATSIFDTRYSFNTTLVANSLTPYKEVYLVGTIHNDGLFYLDSTWWTQTPNDTSKVYILVGACYDSTTSNCRATLYEQNKWYRYDGTNLIEIANDALTISGHTVATDVPADAVFTDTNTTYSMTRDGESVKLTPSSGTSQSITLSSLINGLGEGTSPAQGNDYLVAQYAGGGTSNTTYYRRKVSNVVNGTVVKAALGTDTSTTTQFLNKKGEWSTPVGTTYTGTGAISVNSSTHVISTTAEVNQNAFSNVKVGSTTVAADTKTDTLELVAGSNVTLTPDATNDKVTIEATDTNTTYTFANGTNGFTVTPSGGTAQTVTVTPSITNNVTGSGTSGYLTKWNGANTVTNGPQLGSSTTTYLNNAGSWATPPDTKNTAGSTDTSSKIYLIGATSQAANPQTYSDNEIYTTSGVLTTKSVQVGGGSATMQYNSTTQSIDFIFT